MRLDLTEMEPQNYIFRSGLVNTPTIVFEALETGALNTQAIQSYTRISDVVLQGTSFAITAMKLK